MQLLSESEGEEVMSGKKNSLDFSEFARQSRERASEYHRYHIDAFEVADKQPLPNRYLVKVGKFGLAKLILKESFTYFGQWDVVFSRPCTYGVFSGPVGGFAPQPEKCVGCLRCTIQHPEFVKITPNPARLSLGDSYMNQKIISTIDEEARKGCVPVRGQGYRGRFGGSGWDGMFTDMSEIVRPSRDGIHGRELISTVVDIGSKPMSLRFDSEGGLVSQGPKMMTIQVPFILDTPALTAFTPQLAEVWADCAKRIDSLALLPAEMVRKQRLAGPSVVPVLPLGEAASAGRFGNGTRMVEIDGWERAAYDAAASGDADLLVGVRISFDSNWRSSLQEMVEVGVPVIHFISDNHGMAGGKFVMENMLEAHQSLLDAGVRDKITLMNSGGVVAADHLPKAIICGLDAVALDLPLLVAIQARLSGDISSRQGYKAKLPRNMESDWATQRMVNLSCSWRDQLLEILGAMGIREVRRLRGETGRAMWCSHLEAEAFGDIEGYQRSGE